MPDLFLKSQSDTELRLAHSFVGGWIFAGIGLAVAWAGSNLIDHGSARWMMTGMGVVFALIGIGGGLWRYDLTLDLMARAYRGRRGFWPAPRGLVGSLSELEGVVLTRTWRRSKNQHHAVWVVSLSFSGWDRPASLFETTNEPKGYRKLEELARLLQVPAIDRTGDAEVRRGHHELDRSVAGGDADDGGRGDGPEGATLYGFTSSASVEPPPSGSGIELGTGELGGPMIVLPATGVNAGVVFLALFGLPFLGFGVLALASALGMSPVEVKSTLSAKWIVGGVFTLVGTAIVLGVVFAARAREVIRDQGDALVITLHAFGRHYRRRELAKREIEEIAVKDSRSAHGPRRDSKRMPTEVVLRSDRTVARIAGDRPADQQQWLAKALLVLARR